MPNMTSRNRTRTKLPRDNPIYQQGNHWADPSIEHAASLMRYCFDHRAEAAAHREVA